MGTKYENLLEDGAGNIIQSFFDNFEKSQAEFRNKAGFRMTVIRESIGVCCAWCQDLVGTYDYDSRPSDIYARHKNCSCIVVTKTERGTYQDAWSRKEYNSQREARIAREKEIIKEIEKQNISPKDRMERIEKIMQNDIIKLPDTIIHKSVGAKSWNYEILDPASGEYFEFVEGTKIQNSQVFAGYGTKTPLHQEVAEGLADEFGGDARLWQHCKGIGHVNVNGEDIAAEVHWFQEATAGKHKFKVKYWIDEG